MRAHINFRNKPTNTYAHAQYITLRVLTHQKGESQQIRMHTYAPTQ